MCSSWPCHTVSVCVSHWLNYSQFLFFWRGVVVLLVLKIKINGRFIDWLCRAVFYYYSVCMYVGWYTSYRIKFFFFSQHRSILSVWVCVCENYFFRIQLLGWLFLFSFTKKTKKKNLTSTIIISLLILILWKINFIRKFRIIQFNFSFLG